MYIYIFILGHTVIDVHIIPNIIRCISQYSDASNNIILTFSLSHLVEAGKNKNNKQ